MPSARADFQQAVARYPERPLSLYVHIPFCHKLCYFCGCNKIVTRQQHKADQYLDALEQEIRSPRAAVCRPSRQPAALGRRYANLSE